MENTKRVLGPRKYNVITCLFVIIITMTGLGNKQKIILNIVLINHVFKFTLIILLLIAHSVTSIYPLLINN